MTTLSTLTTVAYGTTIRDNDPRYAGRVAVINGFWINPVTSVRYATHKAGRRVAKVRLDRIFTDGKARLTGWNVVS